jgi:hypothetical protein
MLWKFLLRILSVALSVTLLALLAVSLILAKPQDKSEAPAPEKPAAVSSPALRAETEAELVSLIAAFPAPVMGFPADTGMTFVSAVSSDMAVSGGFARMATLFWQTPDGTPVTLQSVWPADALELLEDGYHFMPYAGISLFGSTSVRMENDASVRIHVATDRALYVMLLPRQLSAQATALCRSLQLFTVSLPD